MQAGAASASTNPLLPDATTAAIPTERRLSIIGLYGSPSHGSVKLPPPRLRLTAAIA